MASFSSFACNNGHSECFLLACTSTDVQGYCIGWYMCPQNSLGRSFMISSFKRSRLHLLHGWKRNKTFLRWIGAAKCLTGASTVGTVAIPIILRHAGLIGTGAMFIDSHPYSYLLAQSVAFVTLLLIVIGNFYIN